MFEVNLRLISQHNKVHVCKAFHFHFLRKLKNWLVVSPETIEHFFFCSFSLFFCFCTESGVDWKAIEAWFAGILLSSTCQLLRVPLAEMWGRDRYHTHCRNIRSLCVCRKILYVALWRWADTTQLGVRMAERGYRALMAVQIPGKPKILLPHNCSSRILITWFIKSFLKPHFFNCRK